LRRQLRSPHPAEPTDRLMRNTKPPSSPHQPAVSGPFFNQAPKESCLQGDETPTTSSNGATSFAGHQEEDTKVFFLSVDLSPTEVGISANCPRELVIIAHWPFFLFRGIPLKLFCQVLQAFDVLRIGFREFLTPVLSIFVCTFGRIFPVEGILPTAIFSRAAPSLAPPPCNSRRKPVVALYPDVVVL